MSARKISANEVFSGECGASLGADMRRREFIAVLGSALGMARCSVSAASGAVHADQPGGLGDKLDH